MPTNTEAPERLYVQLSPNGGTISYKSDPREVHDNGKPVYEYIRAPAAQGDVVDAATVARIVDRERSVALRNAAIEIIYLADSIKFEKSHPPDVLASLIAKHLNGERCYLETSGGHPVIRSEHLFDNADCCAYCGKFAATAPPNDSMESAPAAQVVDRASILEEAAKAAEAYLCTCDEKVMPIDHFSVRPQSIAAEIRALSTTPPAAAPVPLAEDRVEAEKIANQFYDDSESLVTALIAFAARGRAEHHNKIVDAIRNMRLAYVSVNSVLEVIESVRRGGE